ncbi:hypothetical protein C8R44DRAFT_871113 [Mycena epipterygia]|nr:hypothetical protein C8R44DRAFT_871113 [Mycena epipterygia]
MLSFPNFLFGFVLGVLWTVGCYAVQNAIEHGIASLVAFPTISTSTLLIIVNIAVLDMVLIFPQLRSLVRLVKKKRLHISPPAFKTPVRRAYPNSVLNVTVVLSMTLCRAAVFVWNTISSIVGLIRSLALLIWNHGLLFIVGVIWLIIPACEKTVASVISRLRSLARLRKHLHISLPAFKTSVRPASLTWVFKVTVGLLIALYRAEVVVISSILSLIRSLALFIYNRSIPSIVSAIRSFIPAHDKTMFYGDSSMVESEDETNTTLVDESGPPAPSKGTVGSPVPPPSSICLSVSVPSSPSLTTVDLPAPAPVSLNPSVPVFVPNAKHQVPSSVTRSSKQDCQPVKSLSFTVTAPAFVPKAEQVRAPIVDEHADRLGLSASMWAPAPVAALPALPIKKPSVLRRAPPQFWSRESFGWHFTFRYHSPTSPSSGVFLPLPHCVCDIPSDIPMPCAITRLGFYLFSQCHIASTTFLSLVPSPALAFAPVYYILIPIAWHTLPTPYPIQCTGIAKFASRGDL